MSIIYRGLYYQRWEQMEPTFDLFQFFSESFRACLLATSAYRTHKQEVSPMKILPAPTFFALWPLVTQTCITMALAMLSGRNCSLYGN